MPWLNALAAAILIAAFCVDSSEAKGYLCVKSATVSTFCCEGNCEGKANCVNSFEDPVVSNIGIQLKDANGFETIIWEPCGAGSTSGCEVTPNPCRIHDAHGRYEIYEGDSLGMRITADGSTSPYTTPGKCHLTFSELVAGAGCKVGYNGASVDFRLELRNMDNGDSCSKDSNCDSGACSGGKCANPTSYPTSFPTPYPTWFSPNNNYDPPPQIHPPATNNDPPPSNNDKESTKIGDGTSKSSWAATAAVTVAKIAADDDVPWYYVVGGLGILVVCMLGCPWVKKNEEREKEQKEARRRAREVELQERAKNNDAVASQSPNPMNVSVHQPVDYNPRKLSTHSSISNV